MPRKFQFLAKRFKFNISQQDVISDHKSAIRKWHPAVGIRNCCKALPQQIQLTKPLQVPTGQPQERTAGKSRKRTRCWNRSEDESSDASGWRTGKTEFDSGRKILISTAAKMSHDNMTPVNMRCGTPDDVWLITRTCGENYGLTGRKAKQPHQLGNHFTTC